MGFLLRLRRRRRLRFRSVLILEAIGTVMLDAPASEMTFFLADAVDDRNSSLDNIPVQALRLLLALPALLIH